MFQYAVTPYSSAPVSPVRPSPRVRGGSVYHDVPKHGRGAAFDLQPAVLQTGLPAARASESLRALAREGALPKLQDFERQEAALAPERAYAALGRSALYSGGEQDSAVFPLLAASALAGSAVGMAGAAQPGPAEVSKENAASAGPGQTGEAGAGESLFSDKQLPEAGAGFSGGPEARSPERSFMGGVSGSLSSRLAGEGERASRAYERAAGTRGPGFPGGLFSLAV